MTERAGVMQVTGCPVDVEYKVDNGVVRGMMILLIGHLGGTDSRTHAELLGCGDGGD